MARSHRVGLVEPRQALDLVGALAILGRLDEAEIVRVQNAATQTEAERVEANAYLAIACMRYSRHAEARALISASLAIGGRSPCDERDTFFLRQTLGFRAYVAGRFPVALMHARRAFECATRVEFRYGKALAADLLGHCMVQTGEISRGLEMLEEALRIANETSLGWLRQAIRVSLEVYQAQFGVSRLEAVARLQNLHDELTQQDSYSQPALLLELGRQQILRGRVTEGREVLDRACRLVYGSAHRRYGALLNLRYAVAFFREGEYAQALNLVRSAVRELDLRCDRAIEVELRGFERRLLRFLGMSSDAVDARLVALTRQTGRYLSRRMNARAGLGEVSVKRAGEDPLGEICDLVARLRSAAAPEIIASGWLGLLNDALDLEPRERRLVFDLVPGSLTLFDRGNVDHVPLVSTPLLRSVAARLGTGETSKQQLVEAVWGYKYQPLKHDALVYRTISRFRHVLGRHADWLGATMQGYQLAPDVRLAFEGARVNGPSPARVDPESAPERLNYRQIDLLRCLGADDFTDVRNVREVFGVSEITARRDLVALVKMAYLARVGSGRATKYRRIETTHLN